MAGVEPAEPLFETNYRVVELFHYLHGQVIIHPLKGENPKDSKQLTVLNYQAVDLLFQWWDIPPEEQKMLFRKIHALHNFVNNPDEHDEIHQQQRDMQALQKMIGVTKR